MGELTVLSINDHGVAAVMTITIKCLEETGSLSNITWEPDAKNKIVSAVKWMGGALWVMLWFVIDLMVDIERTTTKFVLSRNSCGCLEQKYNSLKHQPKKGACNYCGERKNKGAKDMSTV
jgi:hypothetical protein